MDRNVTHSYNQNIALSIISQAKEKFYDMFCQLKKEIDENVLYLIYSLIEEIPEGRVATYGQIAKLIGKENHSRFVGRALKMSHLYGEYPCHRVSRISYPQTSSAISLIRVIFFH